jgi:ATP/maltotriose-dependent transcriptional regulator MalT
MITTTLDRQRVSERLAAASAFPVILLIAPAGYGKSFALDAYLRTRTDAVVRFNAGKDHGSLTRFVRALAAALEPTLPGVAQSLAIAHERAIQSPKPSDILAAWLAEHLGSEPRLLVIDDLHHCEGERSIGAFIASAIERTRANVRWIIACRSGADLPIATWLARGDADLPIDARTMRLTSAEALRMAKSVAPDMSDDTVEALRATTDGSPAIFGFAIRTIEQEPSIAGRLLASGGDAFGRFADEVFARLTPDERNLLVRTAALPEVDDALLRCFEGEAAPRTIAAIAAKVPQIFEERTGRRHYHGLFLRSLRARLAELGIDATREIATDAALALERAGRISEALASHTRQRNDAELQRLIEAHGFEFLESGYGESIHEAIEALDPYVQMSNAVVLAIKAMAESRLGRFDTAESWFRLALDCAAVELQPQIKYHYGNHLVRFIRREAVTVLQELAAEPGIQERLRAYALAALGPAYVFERRIDDALRTTEQALEIAAPLRDVHLTAKTHHQASYVALFAGNAARAKALASISLACATEHGFFDVAAGALTVLYSVASDIEDDPAESVRLLEAVGDCAAKSGCLTNALFSLVAKLEIEVERGNEDVIEGIDHKLRTLDVACSGRALYEALLPTQALRASWTGDFTGAYRLLASSEDKQWSADRRALRHAEVATYAAAAKLDREAADAIRAALHVLNGITQVDLRVQRARLFVALAMIVMGRSESAADMLHRVDAGSDILSKRLLALRRTLGAILERYRGSRNQNEILAHLAELRDVGFGGVARVLGSLPLADNAMHRLDRLTVAERVAMVRWADGDDSPLDEQLRTIVRKLGCNKNGAALRAVTRHRAAFELAEMPLMAGGSN